MADRRRTILCMASYFKGERFLKRCKEEGAHTILLTVQSLLGDPWPREAIDEIFGLPSFQDLKGLLHAVSYLCRTRVIDRVVALDDFDVETAAQVREHLRKPGLGDSAARLFRDKLAMRVRAREIGVRIPDFVGAIHHSEIRDFLARIPAPWLLKPRSEASSIGIQKLHKADDVWKALDQLADNASFHLIEQMVPGDLYHVDSLVADNKVMFAQPSRYVRPLLEVYHGGGVYATRTLPSDRAEYKPLVENNEKLLTGFGLGRGASHTEFMRAHADSQFYFIETSCRVGGANTAEMVEAATGINLWSEWAKLEIDFDKPYQLPQRKSSNAGVVISLAKDEKPDTSSFNDPEICYRLNKPQHIGFVLCSDNSMRVDELLRRYSERISKEHTLVIPAADRHVN
ncbi:MAG: acetyl-CoA carboxylase biotin carboxylase subunit family protein [Gemmataceae bacterium]